MRTTLAIADDILRELRKISRSTKRPLTVTANEVLRAGLAAMRKPPPRRKRFREAAVDMGLPTVDLTKALELAASVEDEEVVRKLALRK